MPSLPVVAQTALLLAASNVFMTFAGPAPLRKLDDKPWWIAAPASWRIALFEYRLQPGANRIGDSERSPGHLNVLQEAITLSVFVPFARLYTREPLKLDVLWAGLCLVGAVSFTFRCA